MAWFLATNRFKVSGTRRSAKPARNDQMISREYEMPSAGPVSCKKSFTCSTDSTGSTVVTTAGGVGETFGSAWLKLSAEPGEGEGGEVTEAPGEGEGEGDGDARTSDGTAVGV